jgi:hypothetical protein
MKGWREAMPRRCPCSLTLASLDLRSSYAGNDFHDGLE